MFDKNDLKRQIEEIVEATIYSRGLDYFNANKVESIESIEAFGDNGEIFVTGVVNGSDNYDCGLVFDLKENRFITFDCDCPYSFDCKHSVALALCFVDRYSMFLKQQPNFNYNTEIDDLNNFIEYKRDYKTGLKDLDKTGSPRKEETKNFNIKDYYITLSLYSRSYFGIDTNSKKDRNFNRYHVGDLLKKYSNQLSEKEKSLFRLLSISYHNLDGVGKILELAKDIGFEVQSERNGKRQKVNFVDGENISAELNFVEGYNEYWKAEDNRFIFKVSDRYSGSTFIRGENNIISISEKEIVYYQLPKNLIDILLRIDLSPNERDLDNYEYDYFRKVGVFGVFLSESEVLKINTILRDAKKYFDLKTNITDKFKVLESKKSEPSILIDYDNEGKTLKAFAVIDYGFELIPVGETVFCSRSGWRINYKRRIEYRDWKKFVMSVENGFINYARINKKEEINLFKKIYESNGYYGFGKKNSFSANSRKKIDEFSTIYLPRIKELGYKIIFAKDNLDFVSSEFKANFDVDVDVEKDWLYFDVDCYCGDDKVGLDDLIKFIQNEEEFLRTKDGRLLKITNKEELERFVHMLESFHARENGKGFKGKLYNAPELEDIFTSSKHYSSQVADGFKKFMKEVKSGKPIEKTKLPKKVISTLRDYQKEGIDWFYFLRKYRFAGILADDMGLGKTLQALILIQEEKVDSKPSLVVCPKTLLYNWKEEAEKFTPNLKTVVVDGFPSERKKIVENLNNYDLVITSYSSLKVDFDEYKKNNSKFNYLILDEAQFIKNHKTKTAQFVKKIDADYRLALTGTPLENSVSELWSIFEFLMPGFLGTNKNFVKKFQNPIMKFSNKNALERLRKKTECFMLRRTKKEVLKELPPKIEQVSHCQLGDDQNILYQEILKSVKKEIFDTVKEKGFANSQIHILAALTKLRQVCNHPVLLLKDNDHKKYESAKLELFLEFVKEISGEGRKVLVFSQFTKMLDILGKELDENKISYLYLSGKTKNRQDLVREFNEDSKHSVFLISLKAGGTGLNLTSADNVIIFDPWWNPSVENQAIDRAHRMGQKNSVNVYRFITKGTIEEKIIDLQQKKQFLFDNMVGESKDLFKKLTWDDIKNIFN